MKEHGRLLCMKEVLTDIASDKKLDDQQLAMFYVKDIANLRGLDVEDLEAATQAISSILDNPPDDDEKVQLINNREDELIIAGTQMFKQGEAHVSEQLTDIKDALLKKDGIVDSD